jgi:hypothetical protein
MDRQVPTHYRAVGLEKGIVGEPLSSLVALDRAFICAYRSRADWPSRILDV